MKLNEFKDALNQLEKLDFFLPDGTTIPAHFHITEIGLISKHFIDCGGKIHQESVASMQIWVAQDKAHRLTPEKLSGIITLSEKLIPDQNTELEVEYQRDTIGKFGLEFRDERFELTPKFTDCLAKSDCGVPQEKQRISLADLNKNQEPCCTPSGGCC